MSDEPRPTGEACPRCREELQSLGETTLRTGGSRGAWKLLFGEWAELGEGTMAVELLACPRCRRLELKLPERGSGQSSSLRTERAAARKFCT